MSTDFQNPRASARGAVKGPARPAKPNSTRNRIRKFFANSPGREMEAAQFAGWYGVHRVTASVALRELVQAGELVARRSGKQVYYAAPKVVA